MLKKLSLFDHFYSSARKIRAGDWLDLDFTRIFIYLKGWEADCDKDYIYVYPAQQISFQGLEDSTLLSKMLARTQESDNVQAILGPDFLADEDRNLPDSFLLGKMLTHEVVVEVDDDPVPVVNDPEPADPVTDEPEDPTDLAAGDEPVVDSDTDE